jgi:sulfur relay (sulfurtransferase) complex TusBCD TusD component (DsrE family)
VAVQPNLGVYHPKSKSKALHQSKQQHKSYNKYMATAEVTIEPEQAAKPKLCSECGVDRGFYQKQIRRLREKLEYAELNNFKLLSECDKLRKELREAEFRGRSRLVHSQAL